MSAPRDRPGRWLRAIVAGAGVVMAGCRAPEWSGTVLDAEIHRPIGHATVCHNGRAVRTDARGQFVLPQPDRTKPVFVRAPGYRPLAVPLSGGPPLVVRLERFEVRGIYLSHKALGDPETRARVLGWVDGQRFNTLVVDLKDEHGRMSFYNSAPEAGRMGAFGSVRFDDIQLFLRDLRRKHIYVVGRISVFQDALLAKHKPQWRPKTEGRPNLFWLDPFRKEVWHYNLAVAQAAAVASFDEILFDQVRFPGAGELPGARWAGRNTEANRQRCLKNFLDRACAELQPYNVLVWVGPRGWDGREGEAIGAGDWLTQLAARVDGFAVEVQTVEAVQWVKQRVAQEPARARVWLRYSGEIEGTRLSPGWAQVKTLVAACEMARLGGWVLSDPTDRYAYGGETVRKLVSGDVW